MEKSLLGVALASQIMQASAAGADQSIIEYKVHPDVLYSTQYTVSDTVRELVYATPFTLLSKYPIPTQDGKITYYTNDTWKAVKRFCVDKSGKGNIILDGYLVHATKRSSNTNDVGQYLQAAMGIACYKPEGDMTVLPREAKKHHSVLENRITIESTNGFIIGGTSKIISGLRNYLETNKTCQLPSIEYIGTAFNIKYNIKKISETGSYEMYQFTLLPKTNVQFKCWGKNKFVDGKTGKFDKVYLEQMYDIFPKTFKLRFYRTPTPRPRPEVIEKKAEEK